MPRVSILIVNFRAYAEIGSCLESLQQHLDDVEVIVVDHSSDAAAASLLQRTFPWMQLIAIDANPGFAAGVNRAARAARGTYALLLNPDCVVHGDVARELAAWLDGHPRVAAAGALIRESDGSIQASARRFPGITTMFAGRTSWLSRTWPNNPWTRRNLVAVDATQDPHEVDWVSGACMMIRRQVFESLGGLDERFFMYWEDADFCFRLKQSGWSVVYCPGIAVTHFTGRSSALARRQSLVAFHRSAYRYVLKNSGWPGRIFAPFVFLALYSRLAMKLASLELSAFKRTRQGPNPY